MRLCAKTMSNLQADVPEATPILDAKAKRYAKLKERARRFRVLIIGRANAGKTTILKKICNTTDDPEIYDRNGEKVAGLCDQGSACS